MKVLVKGSDNIVPTNAAMPKTLAQPRKPKFLAKFFDVAVVVAIDVTIEGTRSVMQR